MSENAAARMSTEQLVAQIEMINGRFDGRSRMLRQLLVTEVTTRYPAIRDAVDGAIAHALENELALDTTRVVLDEAKQLPTEELVRMP